MTTQSTCLLAGYSADETWTLAELTEAWNGDHRLNDFGQAVHSAPVMWMEENIDSTGVIWGSTNSRCLRSKQNRITTI